MNSKDDLPASLRDNPLAGAVPSAPFPFDRITPAHVRPAVDHQLATARARLHAIASHEGPRTYENTLDAMDEALDELGFTMGIVGHLESVATSPALREVYNAVQPEVSSFYASIALDEDLYRALRAYADTPEAAALTGARKRHLQRTLEEFQRAGAELDAAGKARLREMATEMSKLTTRFSQNVLDATNAWELVITDEHQLAGLPPGTMSEARQSAASRGIERGWRFSLAAPSYIALMTYADDPSLRERMWRAFNTRAASGAHDNRALLDAILRLRRERATLLGFRDFADLVLADRMAKTGTAARGFVDDLTERTTAFAAQEHTDLEAFRHDLEGHHAPPLQPWDVAYYAEKLRRARFDIDEEALRPYFPPEAVLKGLFATAERLYGVRVEPADLPVWHASVRSYTLRDGDETLGFFYADLHPRESKRDGAWMKGLWTAVPGQGPHVALISANVTPPPTEKGGQPGLTHREVETMFHEFGHLLHHMLSRVTVRSRGGTRVAWDFVELPSQIMENWCWEREALALFARRTDTGEILPDAIFERMLRARTFRAASAQMRQLGFATVDLALHRDYDPSRDGDVVAFARRVMSPFQPVAPPDDFAMIASFGHLFASPVGYAGGYYSYKWAEVLDADAFTRFRDAGVFDRAVGRAFRETILARGDSDDAAALFRAFMGRDPLPDALLERTGLTRAAS